MTPIYQILADSQDITEKIADRLLSLTLTDEAGIQSDTVEIRLDDRDNAIALPRTGAELMVSIGYRKTGLSKMGLYTVDEIALSGPVKTLTIRGKAANMPQSIKAPKTRPWDEIALGALVSTIAGEHGLKSRVGSELAGIALSHVDQTEESDLHLLTRLALHFDAVAKPAGGVLLMVKRGEAKSASGRSIPALSLRPTDVSSWQTTLSERGRYGSVTAEWHDKSVAKREMVQAGSGNPAFQLRRSFPDAKQALAAAKAKLAALNRGTGTLEVSLPGNPNLMAEGVVDMNGFRTGIDGLWLVNRVTHTISSQGFSTTFLAESLP